MKEIKENKHMTQRILESSQKKELMSVNDLRTKNNKEPNLESIDDLRKKTTEKNEGIESINDLRRSSENNSLRKWEIKNPELAERKRLESSAKELKNIEWMKAEKWKSLDLTQKRIALENCGKILSKSYDTADPPLFVKNDENKLSLGEYGDGYKYDEGTGRVLGNDYGIKLNRGGELQDKDQKLFGDDPKVALHTYAHEFRHSYQFEQASRYEKSQFINLVHNPEKTKEWAKNVKNYSSPPDDELFSKNPAEYKLKYDKYANQPVEKDANDFATELIDKIFGDL